MTHDVYQVNILQFKTGGEFWACEAQTQNMSPEAQAFKKLSDAMNEYCNDDETPACHVKQPTPGHMYIGRNKSGDGRWCRVRIKHNLNTRSGPQVSCVLLDYGTDCMIPIQQIRELNEEFKIVPYQAKQCFLHGVTPITLGLSLVDGDLKSEFGKTDKYDSKAKQEVGKFLKDMVCAKIEVKHRDTNGCLHVRLYLTLVSSRHVCINDWLVQEGYAVYNDGEIPTVAAGAMSSDSETERGVKTRSRRRGKDAGNFMQPADVQDLIDLRNKCSDTESAHGGKYSDCEELKLKEPTENPHSGNSSDQNVESLSLPKPAGRSQILKQFVEGSVVPVGRGVNVTSPPGSNRSTPSPSIVGRGRALSPTGLGPDLTSPVQCSVPMGRASTAMMSPQMPSLSPSSYETPGVVAGRGRAQMLASIVSTPERSPDVGRGKLPVSGRGAHIGEFLASVGHGQMKSETSPFVAKPVTDPSQFSDYAESDTLEASFNTEKITDSQIKPTGALASSSPVAQDTRTPVVMTQSPPILKRRPLYISSGDESPSPRSAAFKGKKKKVPTATLR